MQEGVSASVSQFVLQYIQLAIYDAVHWVGFSPVQSYNYYHTRHKLSRTWLHLLLPTPFCAAPYCIHPAGGLAQQQHSATLPASPSSLLSYSHSRPTTVPTSRSPRFLTADLELPSASCVSHSSISRVVVCSPVPRLPSMRAANERKALVLPPRARVAPKKKKSDRCEP